MTSDEKKCRRESAFFWEERNTWFSDVWMDLKGTTQKLFDRNGRDRSAAFPFELPYRLINMFSIKGDLVLDPFLGLGTTMYAAMAANRHSVGYEIDSDLRDSIRERLPKICRLANTRIGERLSRHCDFVEERSTRKGRLKYRNKHYHFPVVTKQETDLLINGLKEVEATGRDTFEVVYSDQPQKEYVGLGSAYTLSGSEEHDHKPRARKKRIGDNGQQKLFG
jgi:hypothetical protein